MDCFVHQLKGTFQNDYIQPLGGLRVLLSLTNYDSTKYAVMACSEKQDVTVLKNGEFLKTVTIYTNTQLRPDVNGASGDYEIIVPDKSKLTRFDFAAFSIKCKTEIFNGLGAVSFLRAESPNIIGDVGSIQSNITQIILSNCANIYGDLKNLPAVSSQTYSHDNIYGLIDYIPSGISVLDVSYTKVEGSIVNLPTSVSVLSVEGSNSVYGELLDFAKKRAEGGHTGNTRLRGGKITLDGTYIGSRWLTVSVLSSTSFTIDSGGSLPTYTGTYTGGQWVITHN